MARRKRDRHERKLHLETFSRGIRGKMLKAVSITNELESRYISLEFQDQTELTITLDVRLTGKLELFDCKTGNQRLVRKIGLVPDDSPLWQPQG
jgi:ribosome modulation factor